MLTLITRINKTAVSLRAALWRSNLPTLRRLLRSQRTLPRNTGTWCLCRC